MIKDILALGMGRQHVLLVHSNLHHLLLSLEEVDDLVGELSVVENHAKVVVLNKERAHRHMIVLQHAHIHPVTLGRKREGEREGVEG